MLLGVDPLLAKTGHLMELFHFLRPWMFSALLPVVVIALVEWRRLYHVSSWHGEIDPHLLAFQLHGGSVQAGTGRWRLFLQRLLWPIVAALLSITALAGPTWEQRPVPAYRDQLARVFVFDVSRSMDAQDIKPSRLDRARFKLRDMLRASQGVQVGLVAFAAAPYVISPLTDDVQTTSAMITALGTEIIPVQGSDLGAALLEAEDLMRGAGVDYGDIIAITDAQPDGQDYSIAEQLRARGYPLSILGVASDEGAPIPNNAGFLTDAGGRIVIAKGYAEQWQRLATAGGGRFAAVSPNDDDVDRLINKAQLLASGVRREDDSRSASRWIDRGPWLLFPVVPMLLLLFRRGVV